VSFMHGSAMAPQPAAAAATTSTTNTKTDGQTEYTYFRDWDHPCFTGHWLIASQVAAWQAKTRRARRCIARRTLSLGCVVSSARRGWGPLAPLGMPGGDHGCPAPRRQVGELERREGGRRTSERQRTVLLASSVSDTTMHFTDLAAGDVEEKRWRVEIPPFCSNWPQSVRQY